MSTRKGSMVTVEQLLQEAEVVMEENQRRSPNTRVAQVPPPPRPLLSSTPLCFSIPTGILVDNQPFLLLTPSHLSYSSHPLPTSAPRAGTLRRGWLSLPW